jgi:hypothetical protein
MHALGTSGMTPIHTAAAHSPECLIVLGDAGGDINLMDQKVSQGRDMEKAHVRVRSV